jgi:hypothetical protein
MKTVFIVLGYGIPRNILKDENYNFYLKMVFNQIYTIVTKQDIAKPLIICCGGETDMIKPYDRTEATEMISFFKDFVSKNPFLSEPTKGWQFLPEKKSLSTLENVLNTKKILARKKIARANLVFYCEYTRAGRIKAIVKEVLPNKYAVRVQPIDFDVSANRYLDPALLAKKERVALKHAKWALENPKNIKKHHQLFVEKMEFLRKAGPKAHGEALRTWWQQKINEFEQ